MQARNGMSGMSLALLTLSFGLASPVPAASASPAHAVYPEYRVTVMAPANSAAHDINNAGTVVGTHPRYPAPRAFLNRGKGYVDLGTLGGSASNAVAINDKGQVLGNWTTRAGQQRGFLYYQGKTRDIGTVRGRNTTYTDINNAGYATATGALQYYPDGVRSFLRAPDGRLRDIGNLSFEEPTLTTALALNNRNQIAGESGPLTFPEQPLRAFLWTRGTMRDLGDLGFTPNGGVAVNDRGQVTGYMSVPAGFRNRVAFLYSNGRLIDIDGRPRTTEERSSQGTGINNHGHVVGASDHLSGFIYRGRRMQSLNALIDPRLGWDIAEPRAINDAGQIAATAYRNGVPYAVRLDLIRPHALAAPMLDDDEADAELKSAAPGQAAQQARLEAEAQAREVARPVH